ncbi:hypothetical protein RB195_009386 [Necator americanus]|uniref:ABC transporter domain-containing protein n=1 Tax=Necator americanus TaxID=51031 RepID=A0ABR1CUR2_NECAM
MSGDIYPRSNEKPLGIQDGRGSLEDSDSSGTLSLHTPQAKSVSAKLACDSPTKEGKRLIWRDIYAEIPPQSTFLGFHRNDLGSSTRVVLDQVSGFAEPGQVTFIMGPSGAGKSTLLNILTQKKMRGMRIYGEVAINNFLLEIGDIKRYSAYVQQDDLFISDVTVQEHLMFAARLRLPSIMSEAMRKEIVEDIITEMGLASCRNTKIGSDSTKSISKGEKKRLSFASEILTNPSILFCDEPTSGLDSFMALQVAAALKLLASRGKTVITTIHQPSSQVYELADRLILMSQGQVAYQGVAAEVGEFFTKCSYPRPIYTSLPDHFMKILSRNENETDQDYYKRAETIIEAFEISDAAKHAHYVTHVMTSSSRRRIKYNSGVGKGYAVSWFVQTWWLFVRSFRSIIRNPIVLRVRLIHICAISMILGCIYFDSRLTESTLMNYKGAALRAGTDMIYMFLFPCIFVFVAELPVVIREYQSNIYSPSAYFIATNAADAIQYIVFPTAYSIILYSLAGYSRSFQQYLEFNFVNIIVATLSASLGYAAACICGSKSIAVTYVPIVVSPLFVFAGLYIDLRTIPFYFQIFPHISWFKYAYEAHLIVLLTPIEEIEGCQTNKTYDSTSICSSNNGRDLLRSLGFYPDYYWVNVVILMMMIVFIRGLALLAFIIRVRRS